MTNDFKSRHLVEPEALEFLEVATRPQLTLETLPVVREYARRLFCDNPRVNSDTVVSQRLQVPGLHGDVPVNLTVYVPSVSTQIRPAVLHIHGGGYVAGSAEAEAEWSEWLVTELKCVVVAPDYRLAPETPYPGPVHDCYAALRWIHQNAEAWAIDVRRISVFGGSAGGGLAAAVALMARDRGECPVNLQCLLYPMLDDRTGIGAQDNVYAGEYIWTRADNVFAWRCFLGEEASRTNVSPYAAPARTEQLSNLPATFIWVGALDLFVDESIEYARRLVSAGVPTELHVYPGVTHGNILVAGAPSTRICRAAVLRALGTTLTPSRQDLGSRAHIAVERQRQSPCR